MAYADRNVGGSRVAAVIIVALIVAGIGYAFVTGLAYQYIKKKVEDLNTFDVQPPPPPPPEEKPPPPPDKSVPPPPSVTMPPAVVTVPVPSVVSFPPPPPAVPVPPRPIPPEPPKPPAPPAAPAKQVTPRGNPQDWVTTDDYPSQALRNGDQGRTAVRLEVDASGKVTDCSVTSSSGSSVLDNAACTLLRRRARFNPAEAVGGAKIPGSWSYGFRWQIPKE